MPAWTRPLARFVRRTVDVLPPTRRGLLVALFSFVSLTWIGFGELDLLLFVIGIAGLAMVGLATLAVAAAALYLRRRMRSAAGDAQRLEAGSPISTGFTLPDLARVPMIKVSWTWRWPSDVDCRPRVRDGFLHEEAIARRRGLASEIVRRFAVADAFGLAAVSWQRDEAAALLILPDVDRLRRLPVLQSFSAAEGLPHPAGAADGDRMEIRRYQPGDSPRHILWKSFARTRQLNVRVPERSIDRARKTVAYLLTGPGDEPAAAAARVAVENGGLGEDWIFGADGSAQPTSDRDSALLAIARSGSLDTEPGRSADGLHAFLGSAEVRDEAHCIVFVPDRPTTAVRQALAAGAGFGGRLSFVIGTDGVRHAPPAPWWRTLILADDSDGATPANELTELLRLLASAGSPALVVDRRSGRAHGSAQAGAGAPTAATTPAPVLAPTGTHG